MLKVIRSTLPPGILLAVALLASWFVPLYLDEVNTQILNNRFLQDGEEMITLFPACTQSFATSPPIEWGWVLALRSIYHSWIPYSGLVRATGIFLATLITLLFTWNASLLGQPRARSDYYMNLMLLSLSIGVFPYMLAINRPEQDILLCVGFVSLLLIRGAKRYAGWIVLMAGTYIFSAHPKSVLITPLLAFTIYALVPGVARKILFGTALLFFAGNAVQYYTTRYSCPESSVYQRYLDSWALKLPVGIDDLPRFAFDAWSNVVGGLRQFTELWLLRRYQFEWLPGFERLPDFYLTFGNFTIALALSVGVSVGLVAILRTNPLRLSREDRRVYILGAILIVTAISLAVLQREKFFYFVTLNYPLVILGVFCLAASSPIMPLGVERLGYGVTVFTGVFSVIVTSAAILSTPIMTENRLQPRVVPARLPYLSVNEARPVLVAAALCQIAPNQSSRRIAVDGSTYWPLRETFQPIHVGGFPQTYFLDRSAMLRESLRVLGSEGAVLHRSSIPKDLEKEMLCIQDYCCLSRF